MLINFTFKNYRSFKEQTQFSMEGAKGPDVWSMPHVMSAAAVYGPNASGKSNLLRAIRHMSVLVSTSFSSGDSTTGVAVDPFLLDGASRHEPSEYFIEFTATDGLRYKYWFAADSSKVIEENLHVYRSAQPSVLFERWTDSTGQHVQFGPSFKGAKQQVWKITRPNSLLLSVAAASGIEAVSAAHAWLTRSISFCSAPMYSAEEDFITNSFESHDTLSGALSELVRLADFGIEQIEANKIDPDETMVRGIKGIFGEAAEDSALYGSIMHSLSTELRFKHLGVDGVSEWFGPERESDGTRAALAFFSVALKTLSAGSLLLVDELDGSLHPLLVEQLVRLFADSATNPLQAQLVFTTHDASLISKSGRDTRVLGRDQVWFVQKGRNGSSELFPVSEFSPRPDENIGRNYLNGVYGAVPTASVANTVVKAVTDLIKLREEGNNGSKG